MNPQEIKRRAEEIAKEANLQWANACGGPSVEYIAAELALSNWQPPPPVSPRVLAAREWLKMMGFNPLKIEKGEYDESVGYLGFLAGVAWAEKLAEPVVSYVSLAADCTDGLSLMWLEAGKRVEDYRKAMGTEQ